MAVWQNYWRIVTPTSRKASYQSQTTVVAPQGSDGYAGFSSLSGYYSLLRGAASRIPSYKQFDSMDVGDVARALDVIAEEISNPDKRTELPFQITYQTEENQNVSDTTVSTLRAALRHWSKLQQLNKKTFDIARIMVKYGDCFFRKVSDTRKWEFVDPARVIGIEIDRETGDKVSYHVRPNEQRNGMFGREESVEVVPAAGMIHFSLSNEMGGTAPFGTSILASAYQDWQKLRMLEDSSIIYRIVRAPERRVFYIDVGNKPAHHVKQYIEQIKNEIRQRRTPNGANGQQVDGQYNPESIQEDYYFPVTAAGRGSRVETIAGGGTWEIPELDHFLAKVFRALRVPTSYMRGAEAAGSQYNDGKVGIAYIEELRFANFIQRLQVNLEEVFDDQFKTYLAVTGINLDADLFKLTLPEPQNFALYRQTALDTELISAFKQIEDTPYLSKRFMMGKYLGLTQEEIQMNEAMLKQERGLEDGADVSDVRQIYDEDAPKPKKGGEEPPPEEDDGAQPFGDEPPPDEPEGPSLDTLDNGEEEEPQ